MLVPSAYKEGEEKAKEEADTVAPAAPKRQQDVASTVDGRTKKKIEEAISSLGSCRTRWSEMLQAARRGHVTGGLELRCMEFIESELIYIVVYLSKALSLQHVNSKTVVGWLAWAEMEFTVALDYADPQRQNTLLRRATQCFRHRHQYPIWLLCEREKFYILAESYCKHLPTAISLCGFPHQAVEEGGGLHPVGVNWFELSRARSNGASFPYGSYLLMLYMIMFPYGYKFEMDRLVQKCLCEAGLSSNYFCTVVESALTGGLTVKSINTLAAEAANHYISNLVHWNVITHATDSRHRDMDEAKAWQWNFSHHQHQFLASKAAEMGFVFTSSTLNLLETASATDNGNETRRAARKLALHHNDPNIASLLQKVDLSQTRSLAVSGAVSGSVPLDKFVNLVVLDVEGWEDFGDQDLLRICRSKMFFLVYLSISNTRVSKLPPEIGELHSLEVLDASNTQITELLFGVFEGTRYFRKLDLRGTPIRQLIMPKQLLRLQDHLDTLLLRGTATRLPHDIWLFQGLRTLATVDLSEQPASFLNALGRLQFLTVLAITWSFHQSSDINYCKTLLSSIKRWRDLKSLTIHCGLGCSLEFLGSLSGPPKKLQKFKVTVGRFAGVPQWFHELEHLSFVQITVCKLEAHDLEILKDLPKLKCLVLDLDFIPKEAIVIKNEGFRALDRFSIDCQVPWLIFESGAMPKITYLQLNFCAFPTTLISVPKGITNLCSLTEVALWYNVRYANSSSVKRTVETVKEEVAKCRKSSKMLSLFINGIEQDDVQAVDTETGSATRAPIGTVDGAEDVVQAVHEVTEA